MPKASPLQSSFSGGEWSSRLKGRVDSDRYGTAMATCLNYIPIVQGPLIRRPGSRFVEEVKDSSKSTMVVRFEFSTTQAYVIEFGDQYCRFYRNNGQILDGGSAYEIVTPYAEADLFALRFTQSADILYITHPDYAPRKLTRTGHTAWTLSVIDFVDGPYLLTNTTDTTLTLGGTTGSVSVTASAVDGINGGSGFQDTDIGRLIRWKDAAGNWTWLQITARTSTTVVTATIAGEDASATTATKDWRLGVYSGTTGYPACSTFHEDRLFFAGAPGSPQRLDGSNSGDYENFAPTDADGTITDSNAVGYTLNSADVNVIRWVASDEKGLMIGTVAGEWLVRPSAQNEALSATNVKASPATRHGSANIQAVQADKALLFVQRAGRKVREIQFYFDVDGFRATDLTQLAEHITEGGIVQTAYQKEPQSIVWLAREDGVLLGMTYERDLDTLRVAWHRHELGGFSDADGTHARVESVTVIPSADGSHEELWMVVQRYVNGATKRYIEYLAALFEDGDAQEDAYFVDCGLTYSGTAEDEISGLDHLEGETLSVLADGAVHPPVTVTAGAVTLTGTASTAHFGYGYNSDAKLLPFEAGAADGTALGKTRRTHRVGFLLHRSLGLKIGVSFDELQTLTFRTTADPMGSPPSLFTGIRSETIECDYDFENAICWRQDQPLPSTILAVAPQMLTQDRG